MSGPLDSVPHVPGYVVHRLAGRGGMGAVYVAEQESPRRTVALKVLTQTADSRTLDDFRREAAVIARLEHPRIVPLYGYGEHDGMPYLVMRYLRGGSLADRIRQGPVDLAAAERWVRSVAQALDFAHTQGLVHRDVKPSNILLDEEGRAYLSDFGIAGTMIDPEEGVPLGSAAYMSPEQGRGEAADGRADVYALAVTCFELLTGEKPFTAETALGMVVRHVHDPIPSARARNPALPPAVDELLQWAMAKHPAERPPTAGEFARLLRLAIAQPERPLRALAGPSEATLVRPGRRGPGGWPLALGAAALGLVGLAVVGGGVIVALLLVPTTRPVDRVASAPLEISVAAPTPTPQGLLLVEDFSDGASDFYVWSDADGSAADDGGWLRLTVHTEGIRAFSYSQQLLAQDVVIEVDGQLLSGPVNSEMAVLCRWLGVEDFVAFVLGGDGTASIWKKESNATTTLLDPIDVPGLEAKDRHRLKATCAGSELRWEVDGVLVGQGRDPRPGPGDIAFMAGLREPGELVVVFDDLVVTR